MERKIIRERWNRRWKRRTVFVDGEPRSRERRWTSERTGLSASWKRSRYGRWVIDGDGHQPKEERPEHLTHWK
jgi:hypothetical protein